MHSSWIAGLVVMGIILVLGAVLYPSTHAVISSVNMTTEISPGTTVTLTPIMQSAVTAAPYLFGVLAIYVAFRAIKGG